MKAETPLNCDRDAARWAREFNEVLASKGQQPLDPGWLIGWFANAMMCGEDTYRWRTQSEKRVAHSKSEYRRLTAQGADVLPPSSSEKRLATDAAPQENKVRTAPSDAGFKAAGTCTGRGLPNEPAVAAPSSVVSAERVASEPFFCSDKDRFGSSDCEKQCPACAAKPVAWLHNKHPNAYVITARVKELWLACNPEHVENYTVPSYDHPELSAIRHALDCIVSRHIEDEFIPTEYWDMAKEALKGSSAPSSEAVMVDLGDEFWKQIQQAASESNWIPPEYMMNDWVADICAFLRGEKQTMSLDRALNSEHYPPSAAPAAPSSEAVAPKLDRDWWRRQGIDACMDRMEEIAADCLRLHREKMDALYGPDGFPRTAPAAPVASDDADLLATIDKLVRIGGKRFPCFDEDEFLDAVRARFARSAIAEKTCPDTGDPCKANCAPNCCARIARLKEIEHLAWHLMDSSEENAATGEVTIHPMRDDYGALSKLLPEGHP